MNEIKPIPLKHNGVTLGCKQECPFLIENKYTDEYHFQCGYCDMKPVIPGKGGMCNA